MSVFRVYLDRDTEVSHGINVVFALPWNHNQGVNFSVQWRSWQCDETGYDPWMLAVRAFFFGTFFGVRPFAYYSNPIKNYLSRCCCSNGIGFGKTLVPPFAFVRS